jgi:hypothetical protein
MHIALKFKTVVVPFTFFFLKPLHIVNIPWIWWCSQPGTWGWWWFCCFLADFCQIMGGLSQTEVHKNLWWRIAAANTEARRKQNTMRRRQQYTLFRPNQWPNKLNDSFENGPAIPAHGSLDLKQEIQIQIQTNLKDNLSGVIYCSHESIMSTRKLLYQGCYQHHRQSKMCNASFSSLFKRSMSCFEIPATGIMDMCNKRMWPSPVSQLYINYYQRIQNERKHILKTFFVSSSITILFFCQIIF